MFFKFKKSLNLSEDWLDKKEFSKIINREINLSFRTGLALSLISIDMSKIKSSKAAVKNRIFPDILKFLAQYVSENMREEDFKCYRTEGVIDILLINTAAEGAAITTQKIYDSLKKSFNQPEYLEILKQIVINNNLLNEIANRNTNGGKKIQSVNRSNIANHSNLFVADDQQPDSDTHLGINVFPNGLISVTDIYSLESSWKISELAFIFTKRIIDLVFTIINLILFSPLLILIAITIKLTSKGPVFFTQERYGQFKTPFTFYKFRTMKVDNDDNVHREYVKKLIKGENNMVNLGTEDKPFYKIKNDDRVTKIGKLLRKTSLDELPQFINVLKGDMSIVGPRPPLTYEVESYKNWHMQRLLSVKPGITGLWQVSGKNKTTFDEMVRLDLHYIKNRSALLDMHIMLKTIPAMFN